MNASNHGVRFTQTSSGTGTALATQSGTTSALYYVTDISASSTGGTTGTWTLYAGASGSSGTAVLWQGAGPLNVSLSTPLPGFPNGSVYLIVNGTTATYANIIGYTL